MAANDIDELNRQSGFSRACHSIRTRFSLASGVFLLITLVLCYIGGRIVLVHFLRDAESQVQGIGLNVTRLVNRNADHMYRTAARGAERYDAAVSAGAAHELKMMLTDVFGLDVSLAARLDASGRVAEACMTGETGASPVELAESDFKEYLGNFAEWVKSKQPVVGRNSAGILCIRGRTHYGALVPCRTGGYLLLAMPFDMRSFTMRMNENLSGMEVRVTPRANGPSQIPMTISRGSSSSSSEKKPSYGITPMLSEAMSFYSGGFWEFAANPLEASFTIRDIAGNPISTVAVSLPRTFSGITNVALSRLTFFITMAGIILILPIFWFQSQILLNPLSRMIARIREVGERHNDLDCPRLEWSGKDEFAQLAVAVNRMLETLSGRAVAVAQSEARQKAMIENLPDGLVIFDRRHRVVSIVKQPDGVDAVPGFAEGAPIDGGVYGIDGDRATVAAIDSVFAGQGMRRLHLTASGGLDNPREFSLRLSLMDDLFALALIRDVTAELSEHESRINAENRLARVRRQESMANLAAGIAHDVNNVLAVVLNTVEITWIDGLDPDTAAAVDTIRDAVRRGTGMMRELMTYAGETKIQLKRCDPASLVEEVSRLASGTIPSNVLISYNLPEDLPAVDADPDQFWKIFFNLAKNAAEAMNGRAGEIAISAEAFEMTSAMTPSFTGSQALVPGPGVLFWVSDNGPGIPPDILKRIFDPYVSTKAQGRGLGLAIVASIVAAHGGGISVQSEIAGGTTFNIFIPVSKLPPENKAEADGKTPRGASGKVLVVDDDKGILTTMGILFKVLGMETHVADNPDTALDLYRRFAPSLSCVVLDANFGRFDAVHLLRAMRVVDSRVPVVVASGATEEQARTMFSSQPFNGFLAKPYTLSEVKEMLAKHARQFH